MNLPLMNFSTLISSFNSRLFLKTFEALEFYSREGFFWQLLIKAYA